ncbi:MAG TPA: sulfatase [Polyangiaceae bacterium]|nr:sulfatase [Polyangiaceae bacterium]
MRVSFVLGGWLLLATSLSGCKQEPTPAPAAGATGKAVASVRQAPSEPQAPVAEPALPQLGGPYNVLLILIDSMRWDMPWAGYPRDIAPRLTAFAREWALFPRAYSLSSYTAKSVVPALAGKYPSEMLRDAFFFTRWLPDNVLVSEMAQAAGHRTLAGHGHGYFMPGLGVNQGYDDYRLLPGTFLDNTGVHDVNSDRLNALAKQMLSKPENVQQANGKRFFAYFHFLDPHFSYHKHPGHPDFGNKSRDLYDNEIHFTDHWVGDLIDFVLAAPWGKDTAIIVSADHGEGFGERGRFRHAYDVWESLVRVPLLVRVPGAPPRRIELARGHIDLAPTIAELMGLKGEGFRGQSLVPELLGAVPQARPVLVDLPRADLMDRRRAFIDGEHKLIIFGDEQAFELFNVLKDPTEEHELSREQPTLFESMKRGYAELARSIPNVDVVGPGKLKGAPPGQRW